MRLVDADELGRVFIGKHYGVNAIKYFINMQPTIDIMPVKHGRWLYTGFMEVKCSECGEIFHELENTNYCPNCGARMNGDKNG